MARKCRICTHPQRSEIEAALLQNGASNRRISAQYGMGETSVRRHRAAHMGQVTDEVAADPDVVDAKTSATQAVIKGFNSLEAIHADWEWCKSEFMHIAETAKAKGKPDVRAVEAIAKLATDKLNAYMKYAELREDRQPLEENPEYRQQISRLLAALEPYPEARQAAAGVLLHE